MWRDGGSETTLILPGKGSSPKSISQRKGKDVCLCTFVKRDVSFRLAQWVEGAQRWQASVHVGQYPAGGCLQ